MRALLLTALLSTLSAPALAETRIASWNIRNLGWDNGKDYAALAEVGSLFDLIAVQEVMSEEGIGRLEAALEARTGADWDRLCSHLIGRGSYREMYCFTWRADRVTWVEGAVVYTDDRDLFAREPFSAVFETHDRVRFLAATLHAIYGEDVAGREAEARALRAYHDWLRASFPGLPVLLMGDFNLPPTNPAWAPLGEVAFPLIREGATTISTTDGRFANLYDNIWVDVGADLPISGYGRVEFPGQILGISHEAARERVSDHIPVYVTLAAGASARFAPNDVEGGRIGVQAGTEGAAPTAAPAGSEADASGPIIGNARSKVYHLPGCPSYDAVGAGNRRPFASEAEALSAGYRRAGNC
ncbi:endonuclease/exonuclease/phosphatase family metal-dependent hydrolase [Gemmobacter caeni]|uniref:Endonuclease/exonuclease/phosphatase family metal-dependent hydrolase n=1 Tax=Gemmobacter caeni TaxID=589035 RepID=A0A2T6B8L2_9RHOB|nr:endonuclease/exonuclease/phosphatase family protein [Gemmobacter caeni]PTX52396.1 endonuclease/exonuclease/phosphatase family metal-dependent hydrolase [Gemmobacter caeni]TWJ02933.1 endonuclease/exonuclease/phosphatase family metal-dependent hydrolase [Gemmobacter caeni]